MSRAIGVGFTYFVAVFAAGFVLGVVRVTWLVPRLGERGAVLVEIPFMLAIVCVIAYRIARKYHAPLAEAGLLVAGLTALVLLVTAELGLVLSLRGLGVVEYLQSRDRVSETAYLVALAVFALAPWRMGRYLTGRG